MSQKLINTRIGLKYDTYANWTQKGSWSNNVFTPNVSGSSTYDAGFKPLKGEVIFYEVPQNGSASNPNPNTITNVVPPAILFKVGDGTHFLKDLPWGSAIAADVYAWAKNQSLLGGTNSGGTWTWSSDSAYAQEQAEVQAFIYKETSNIKIKVSPISTPAGQTGDHWYQTYVSQDGGNTWEATGDPFQVEIDAYTAGDGLNLTNNEFSIKTDSDYLSVTSADGLDVVTTTVTYTAASGDNQANLSASGTGLVTNAAITPIKNYIDAKAGEYVVTVSEKSSPNTGYLKTYEIKQNNVLKGEIDIPKDYLVKSATSGTVTAADKASGGKFENDSNYQVGDPYLDFVINTKDTTSGSGVESHVYVNMKNIADVYTGDWTLSDGQGDQNGYVKIEINSSNEVSAHYYVQALSTASGSNDGLATAYDVKTYITNAISSATPNIESGDGIDITTSGSTKTISIELDETKNGLNIQGNSGSGLVVGENGLAINDSLLWVLRCGGAEQDPNNP